MDWKRPGRPQDRFSPRNGRNFQVALLHRAHLSQLSYLLSDLLSDSTSAHLSSLSVDEQLWIFLRCVLHLTYPDFKSVLGHEAMMIVMVHDIARVAMMLISCQ